MTEPGAIAVIGCGYWGKNLVRNFAALGRLRHVYSHRLNFGKMRREKNILWSSSPLPHNISMPLCLADQEPDSVSAIGACYLNKAIADVTTTHLSFPGGENAHVFVSWLHPYIEETIQAYIIDTVIECVKSVRGS